MRTFRGLAVLALITSMSFASVAAAQPGAGAPPPPPPVYRPPPPPPPPGYGGYPQYGHPTQAGLTQEDMRLLERGIISPEAHVGGAFLSIFLGFGSGQAAQGRWTDTGWIFTVGEAASIAAIIIGVGNDIEDCAYNDYCNDDNDGLIAVGIIGFIGLHLWEIVDSIAGPSSHNRKVRNLHMRLGYPPPGYYSATPFVAPSRDGGGVAGVTFRF